MYSKLETPVYPSNGNLRMYNMFPYRNYDGALGIEGMIRYIPEVARMGYNAVWINPLQSVGTLRHTHPDGKREASGSLYAMGDDEQLNPTIFPLPEGIDPKEQNPMREAQLKAWTKTVRNNGMFPLFDLVLNHIGISESDSPLQTKLRTEATKRNLNLLSSKANNRWPDIQELDYYKKDSKKHGLTVDPLDLDMDKINTLFETLWEPLITRYIKDYGFMGFRIDAITHVPVAVQQRAIRLVQQLVKETYGTEAIIVGELMISTPTQDEISALTACGLTHCLNPASFFWGHNQEGGYNLSESPFLKQNNQLMALFSGPKRHVSSLHNLIIIDDIKEVRKQENTIYLFKVNNEFHFALNRDKNDVSYEVAQFYPISILEDKPFIEELLIKYESLSKKLEDAGVAFATVSDNVLPSQKNNFICLVKNIRNEQVTIINSLKSNLHQSGVLQQLFLVQDSIERTGGLLGVVGNHDVGTLKAKVMLDLAYSTAIKNAGTNQSLKTQIDKIYKEFKQVVIKAVKNSHELIVQLKVRFELSDLESSQLFLDLNMRMREKIFVQSMMCTGGWYSLAGDELGVCHKPEVFEEYAKSSSEGPSLIDRRDSLKKNHDFRGLIRAINMILKTLPQISYNDKTTLHQRVLSTEIPGEKLADILFMVKRYNAYTKQTFVMGHCSQHLTKKMLLNQLHHLFEAGLPDCTIYMTDENGRIKSYDYIDGMLMSQSNGLSGSSPRSSYQFFSQENDADYASDNEVPIAGSKAPL